MNFNSQAITIELPEVALEGFLKMVDRPKGLIIFVHGAGSSRLSPRNTFVAEELNNRGFSTLLFDLLTEDEDRIYENRFNIALITDRLIETTQWLLNREEAKQLPFGYFGASTGAAAALKASVNFDEVKAIVSRGGRPDMVLHDLPEVNSPTLLIVGGLDNVVIDLNQKAEGALNCTKKLVIIDGATHLFEEPGKLEIVAEVAAKWFLEYLK